MAGDGLMGKESSMGRGLYRAEQEQWWEKGRKIFGFSINR